MTEHLWRVIRYDAGVPYYSISSLAPSTGCDLILARFFVS
jgi:hypothetical protein